MQELSNAQWEELVAWLRAALSEDERVAARWRGLADEVGVAYGNPDPPEGDLNPGDRAYFALHEAADRVLAEIATIRRILDAHLDPRQGGPWGGCGDDCEWKVMDWVVRVLAEPLSALPGFKDEWRLT